MLTDENGLHISQRNLTVSTCGLVPRIRDLAKEGLQITLALSLHASNQEKRLELMPVAKSYDNHEAVDAMQDYFEETGRRVTFEYSLVAGVNDTEEDARELAELIHGINCHVNLIPVNPIKERDFVQPDGKSVQEFKNKLEKCRINVTIRREMGRDIDGACGQLRKRNSERQDSKKMKISSLTDIGNTREMNQDYLYSSEESVGKLPNLFLVADGMGGHKAGEFASRYVVEHIVRSIKGSKEEEAVGILSESIETANRKLKEYADAHQQMRGMGTTIVAAVIQGRTLLVANVGDSRLYIVGDEITQVTQDHSLVQEMVRLGQMDPQSARNHPDKNIITRAVGVSEKVKIDIFERQLRAGEYIILCSDGLTNMVEDSVILQILHGAGSLSDKAERLIELANKNGGKDNITVIIIEPNSDEVAEC